ncbi:hypothetical protein K474DRAFT_1701462 [Panus rudis PR-1116 ss-1]|nr:hypothetical protein K474DRAFT_1701462 [Panus rudis PR-1116 ss-1]
MPNVPVGYRGRIGRAALSRVGVTPLKDLQQAIQDEISEWILLERSQDDVKDEAAPDVVEAEADENLQEGEFALRYLKTHRHHDHWWRTISGQGPGAQTFKAKIPMTIYHLPYPALMINEGIQVRVETPQDYRESLKTVKAVCREMIIHGPSRHPRNCGPPLKFKHLTTSDFNLTCNDGTRNTWDDISLAWYTPHGLDLAILNCVKSYRRRYLRFSSWLVDVHHPQASFPLTSIIV